ncbi:hypothetical protein AMC83_CH01909 [Rhizobium phaseoli]|uniref:hypothetical protein n=1 Tax=Rhizobium phaseoli TaxID=396 RepID=UPI0007E9F80E|nr:hypothetical protein [Rhizobium phaseoli]ANL71892.1 hypothetical protein AMC83_CH01909 [Rhizobium phaseoli]
MTREEALEVLDVLLGVIIADNRKFDVPPPAYKRKRHITRVMKLYDKLMEEQHTHLRASAAAPDEK